MGRRYLHRRPDGQFRRGDLESFAGVRVSVCPTCRSANPYTRGPLREINGFIDPASFNHWDAPTTCHHCGEPLTT